MPGPLGPDHPGGRAGPAPYTRPVATGPGGRFLGPRAVLVPVKHFSDAKARLAPALSPAARARLAREMAERVIGAARHIPVAVVCDSTDVATWARGLGALVVWAPERGLNHAVQDGVRRLSDLGVAHITVAHADLPRADDLTWVGDWPGITLIPDRREDGTTVIGLPSDCRFVFSYGPGSFGRHRAEARRLGLATRVVHSDALSWDVDVPADLETIAPSRSRRRQVGPA